MTTEEKKERLVRLRAIRRAQRSVVTKNVSKVNDIIEDEAFTFTEQVQQLEVISRLLIASHLFYYTTASIVVNRNTFGTFLITEDLTTALEVMDSTSPCLNLI